MENLFSATLKEISDEMQSIATALLNSNGMESRELLELYKRLSAANLKLAPVMGSVNYFEREHGSFRELATHKLKHPAPAQPVPGLPAITLPEGVTLEAFADNILPRHEEKRGSF